MGHVFLICFRAATRPYDVFVQGRNYISAGQTHPCVVWRAENELDLSLYLPALRTQPRYLKDSLGSSVLSSQCWLDLRVTSFVCRQVNTAEGVTGLLIYSQGERDGEECHILCANQSLRLKQIIGHLK